MTVASGITAGPGRAAVDDDELPDIAAAPQGLPRLLPPGEREDLAAHQRRLGPVPCPSGRGAGRWLLALLEDADLVGRGGAAFPTARKLRTVVDAGRAPVVVVNGTEGEPASAKDRTLLALAPHLVLDGVAVVAAALGATEAVVCVAGGDPRAGGAAGAGHLADTAARSVQEAIAERRDTCPVRLARPPHTYVTGESSALARWLGGGPALPAHRREPLARRGVDGRPTVLDNAETFAHLALVARFGPAWYRSLGPASDPGTTLVTVTGAVRHPGVAEIVLGSALPGVLEAMGGTLEPIGGVLLGGYGGQWVGAAAAAGLTLSLRGGEATTPMGPGIVGVLPASACGLGETAGLVRFLAGETAGQCGPCVHGLPALADAMAVLARPSSGGAGAHAEAQLRRWCGQLAGRGACGHPDGVVRLVRSALDAFADDVERHAGGRPCGGVGHDPVLPLPHAEEEGRRHG